ncbi:MAG: HNH endonuclease [Planctomycetes bacterium]|nr:HNH endonuclease [Planctomycetota bacterium]
MVESEPQVPQSLREKVFQLAVGCCEYCLSQASFSPSPFSVEHIVPRADGGANEIANLALACMGCNGFKGLNIAGIDPQDGEIVPLFHPRRDRWATHFEWEDAQLVGRTPQARATIDVLRINDSEAVALRRLVLETGASLE